MNGVQIVTLCTACRMKVIGILPGGLDPKILGLAGLSFDELYSIINLHSDI